MTYRMQEHVLMTPLTTFRIGGPARWLVDVTTAADIRRALDFARTEDVPFAILGEGSNVLVSDAGFQGLVIHLDGGRHRVVGEYVYAEAGANLEALIRESSAAGLTGWESLAGIPGTIGGAVRGNAGAFGTEIKDVLVSARAMDAATGALYDFSADACEFEYRDSIFKRETKWIITHAVFRLSEGDREKSAEKIAHTIEERERRHLQRVRAAGSFFKNPTAPPAVRALFEYEKDTKCVARRVPAGWLIEKVGGKGMRIGGVLASQQHPNYLTNFTGDAQAADVIALARELREKVRDRYKIALEPEVSLIGFE
ncbi:MAG TPA: UDP-N-acetylmuramate dehydrogenase [Candidatus Paceibacterota bacterium]|nr:UDP-N-acetylmuramate dehydrogenase [Candidatus Paceibacterota bacterium]